MPAAVDALNLVKARFTGRDAQVDRAFRHDTSFRSLCLDYRDCVGALERLQLADAPGAAARRDEYAQLLEELACEIRDWLATHDAG